MGDIRPWQQYEEFADFVKTKARYVLDERQRRFLKDVLESSADRETTIPKDQMLWRAVVDEHTTEPKLDETEDGMLEVRDVISPLSPLRMKPFPDRAVEGRANPKGIPCLYCSTDRDTAMKEVRPWVGAFVSVGEFQVLRDLRVVDCSREPEKFAWPRGSDPPDEVFMSIVWERINAAFMEPVTRTEDVAAYAPTQILAETFRTAGYDAIVYGSSLGVGKTAAIFDTNAAKQINCGVFQVGKVEIEFDQKEGYYFLL